MRLKEVGTLKIGFVGLGIMGRPMAMNLLRSGHELYVNDLNPQAVQAVCAHGAKAADQMQIAQCCEAVFTILPNGNAVHQVLLGENGMLSHMASDTLAVDMSSITPEEARACHRFAGECGVHFLDAPVSGGEPKAVDGTLAFMVGGTQKAFEAAKPLLGHMGTSITLVGEGGAGCVTKLANQVIVNVTIAAISEALVLATKAGADPKKVYHAIRGGLAGSTVLDAKVPMMLKRNFEPGGKLSINMKDMKNVLATAHQIDVHLPMSAGLYEIMTGLKNMGLLENDHSGIVRYYECLANVEVCSV